MADLTTNDIEAILDAPAGEESAAAVASSGGVPTAKRANFMPLVGVGLVTYAATESIAWSVGIGLLAQFLAAQARR